MDCLYRGAIPRRPFDSTPYTWWITCGWQIARRCPAHGPMCALFHGTFTGKASQALATFSILSDSEVDWVPEFRSRRLIPFRLSRPLEAELLRWRLNL